MKTVSYILKTKGSEVSCVSPDIMVREALRIMAEKNIGAIVVMDNDKLVGIFSERDYARKIILKDKSSKTTPISQPLALLYRVRPRRLCPAWARYPHRVV